ncbi:hypothetical protein [Oscillibacter sp.]|uniref:hypothetical protein n=1 Tax=Oscillibacter sp. TaxID=1945593 RepID=UPI0033913627
MKKGVFFTLSVIGLVLIAVGLYFAKSAPETQGVMRVLPYYCIGIGCGAFGHGVGELIALKAAGNLQKQIEIEKKDERNIAISNYAKGKAFDAMIYIFGALIVSFGLMNLAPYVVLMLVFAYLLVAGIAIYYRCKYDKEM